MPTLEELQIQVDGMEARLNALDGTGLTDPSTAVTTVLASKVNGLKTTVNQVGLLMQQRLTALQTEVNALKTLVNTHLGI
jgi:hypothetical protein